VKVGDRVRIQRDETKYPSKGTWPRFRGRAGVVVEINRDHKRPHLTEYGVVFDKEYTPGKSRPGSMSGSAVTWFKVYEMRILASDSNADSQQVLTPIDGAQKFLAEAMAGRWGR